MSWHGLYDGNTVILPTRDREGLSRRTAVFYHADWYQTLAVEKFRDFLIEKFSQLR